MKLKISRPATKAVAVGEVQEFEVEITQEELDGVIRERLNRQKETLGLEKAEVQKLLDAATKDRDALKTRAEGAEGKVTDALAKAAAAETKATEAEAKAGKQLVVVQKEKQVLAQLVGEGVSLPEVYLTTIKVEEADTDDQIKAKVTAVVDRFKKDLEKHGGGRTMGTDANGGGNGDGGMTDADLLQLARKDFPMLSKNYAGNDAKIIQLMREKLKAGEIKKKAAA